MCIFVCCVLLQYHCHRVNPICSSNNNDDDDDDDVNNNNNNNNNIPDVSKLCDTGRIQFVGQSSSEHTLDSAVLSTLQTKLTELISIYFLFGRARVSTD
jgi:hypothetical protein